MTSWSTELKAKFHYFMQMNVNCPTFHGTFTRMITSKKSHKKKKTISSLFGVSLSFPLSFVLLRGTFSNRSFSVNCVTKYIM